MTAFLTVALIFCEVIAFVALLALQGYANAAEPCSVTQPLSESKIPNGMVFSQTELPHFDTVVSCLPLSILIKSQSSVASGSIPKVPQLELLAEQEVVDAFQQQEQPNHCSEALLKIPARVEIGSIHAIITLPVLNVTRSSFSILNSGIGTVVLGPGMVASALQLTSRNTASIYAYGVDVDLLDVSTSGVDLLDLPPSIDRLDLPPSMLMALV
eukprot:gene24463-10063_t